MGIDAVQWSLPTVPVGFVIAALLIELTPGPNMTYLAALSLAAGRRAGFAAVAGIAAGLLIVGVIAATGIATLISESRLAYDALRWAGVAYFLWLAYESWRGADEPPKGEAGSEVPARTYFTRGLVTNLLNPKAAIFYVAVLPQFFDVSRPALGQSLALSIAYVATATAVHLMIVVGAHQLRPLIVRSVEQSSIRRAFAVALTLVAVWVALGTRRD